MFAFDTKELFSAGFCVVRPVSKFDFRPVVNETSEIWRPVARLSWSERDFF